jgi:hypothetical protein
MATWKDYVNATTVLLALDVVFLFGFLFRLFTTRARPYLFLFLSVLFAIAADALQIGFRTRIVSLIGHPDREDGLPIDAILFYCIVFSFLVMSNLLFDLTVVSLLRSWLLGVQDYPIPSTERKNTSMSTSRLLQFAYPFMSLLYISAYVVMVRLNVSTPWMQWVVMAVGIGYILFQVVQLSICIWLWSSIRGGGPDAWRIRKRNQMIRLVFLTLFTESAQYMRAGGSFSVFWVIRCVIALWSGALVAYEEKPGMLLPGKEYT